jgi:hypothetical protein
MDKGDPCVIRADRLACSRSDVVDSLVGIGFRVEWKAGNGASRIIGALPDLLNVWFGGRTVRERNCEVIGPTVPSKGLTGGYS